MLRLNFLRKFLARKPATILIRDRCGAYIRSFQEKFEEKQNSEFLSVSELKSKLWKTQRNRTLKHTPNWKAETNWKQTLNFITITKLNSHSEFLSGNEIWISLWNANRWWTEKHFSWRWYHLLNHAQNIDYLFRNYIWF